LTEEHQLKNKEKDKKLDDLKKQIEELKRKAEQGSQVLQGDVAELTIKEHLETKFPLDNIKPVGKGISGADVLQEVISPVGQNCGTIIWESKNTKRWNNAWIAKLRDDQISSKADVAIIVSAALPRDVTHFTCMDGTWVTGFPYFTELAMVIRESLIQLQKTKTASQGKDEKMDLIYDYLSGPEFRQRVQAMVESFVSLRDELENE